MALTDTKHLPQRPLPRLIARVTQWLTAEHSLMQRMAGAAFAVRIASAGIVFLSQILLARWMGDAEFGTYVYAWTWLMVIGEFVHLGVPLTAQRFIPEYRAADALDSLRGYFIGSIGITFAAATVAAITGALIVYAVEDALDAHEIMPFYFACIALPLYACTFMFDAMARSYNWINLALVPPYIVRPLLLIAGVVGLRVSGLPIDAASVMGMLAAVTWLTALVQLAQLARRLRGAVPRGAKRFHFRPWLQTALPIVMVWGMYTLLTSTDVLVLKQFRPAEEVAHYYAATKTLALLGIIQFAVAASAAHHFTAFHVAGDSAGLSAFAASTVRWVFWPALAATVLMLALGRPVLSLFGAGFSEGYPAMAVLAVGLLARASIGPAERLLNMLGQQRICALAYAGAFTVNLLGCLVLAPRYGAVGVASATACAFIVESLLLFLIARRRLGLHMFVLRPRASRSRAPSRA